MASCSTFLVAITTIIYTYYAVVDRCCGASFDRDEVVAFIETSMKCHANPAVAVGVVKDGKVLLNKGFGTTDIDTGGNVSTDTLFGVASISKSFTATLLVKLLDEQTNLTVNSKVRDLLGDKFQMPDEFRTNQTTFADLLSHRTAVPPNNRIRYDNNLTRANIWERLPMLTSPQDFRVEYMYSNVVYGAITRLAEIIGGERYEQLVTKHLFEPLGMTRSTFASVLDFGQETNLAKPYMELDGPREFQLVPPELSRRWAEFSGSGSVMSTTSDMVKWLNFHLSDGTNEQGQRLLSEAAFAELHKSRFIITPLSGKILDVPTFPFASVDTDYAFGLRNGYYRGYKKITHSGSTSGYRALMTLLPTEKIGVITLLTGRDDHYLHRVPLHTYLLDSTLGLEPWLNQSTICTFPEPWKKRPNVPVFRPNFNTSLALRLDAEQYEGVYHNDAYGYMTLDFNATLGTLILTYGFGTWQLMLWPSSKDSRERFFGKGIAPFKPFDVKPFYFVTHPKHDDVIVGVNASGFEWRVPPVFCRVGHKDICTQAIFEAQTYNVGKCKVKGCDDKITGNDFCRTQPVNVGVYLVLVITVFFVGKD